MRVKGIRPSSSRASFRSTKVRRPSKGLRTVAFARGAMRSAKFLKRNF